MRILVTGARDWDQPETVDTALTALVFQHAPKRLDETGNPVGYDTRGWTVVHGACPTGADKHAAEWVDARQGVYPGLVAEPHPADWSHGPQAGPMRNEKMVLLGADVCLAFIGACTSPRCRRTDTHPSHGTASTIRFAENAGIPVLHHYSPALINLTTV